MIDRLHIRLEDLYIACETCAGMGYVPDALEPGGQLDPHAMDFCDACKTCNGRGGVLTESGAAVIELIDAMRGTGKIGVSDARPCKPITPTQSCPAVCSSRHTPRG